MEKDERIQNFTKKDDDDDCSDDDEFFQIEFACKQTLRTQVEIQ